MSRKRRINIFKALTETGYQITLCVFLLIGLLIAGSCVLNSDFGAFFSWWAAVLIIGLCAYPITVTMFSRFSDKGYMFSKGIGIALSGFFIWLFSSVKLVKFQRIGCFLAVILVAVISAAVVLISKRNKNTGTFSVTKENIRSMLVWEVIFLAMFLFWTYLKGFNPAASGTEKQMDYAFMQAMMKSDYMPAEDMWFSGNAINYYYVGQFFAVYLTKLTGVGCDLGYNLCLMLIAAFVFCLPSSLMCQVAEDFAVRRNMSSVKTGWFKWLTTTLTGGAVLFAGNGHYILFDIILPPIRDLLGITALNAETNNAIPVYWFPNSTRYIGYFPETADKTIHEFPSYSFVLGDLHAHVINLLFVLTLVGILYTYVTDKNRKNRLIDPAVLFTGFYIGLFHTTNFWDFPIYFVVAGALILFTNAVRYGFKLKALWTTTIQAAEVLAVSYLVSLPFSLNFKQISSEIALCEDHTPLYQIIVLWGLPLCCTFVFLGVLIKEAVKAQRETAEKTKLNPVFRFINSLSESDLFVITISLCAAGLVLLPEVVYVVDIYTGDYKRANTMFKLTYQAFVLFGMSMPYFMMRSFFTESGRKLRNFTIVALILLLLSFGYFKTAADSWFGGWQDTDGYKGLDCDEYLLGYHSDDHYAAKWINENIEGRPVMLEAYGDSYTNAGRMSVLTGLPTVLGWKTHEWLWQSDGSAEYPPELTERSDDIYTIYTSHDPETVMELIEKYDIEYIYVGYEENALTSYGIDHKNLQNLGTVVYPEHFDSDYSDEGSYIIKIDR